MIPKRIPGPAVTVGDPPVIPAEKSAVLAESAPVIAAPGVPSAPVEILNQLRQLITATPDVKIVSPEIRDRLVKRGLVAQGDGFNIITPKGIGYLVDFGLL